MTIQILNSSDYELKQIARKIQLGVPGIFFEQDLTQANYIKLMKRFGECEHPDLFMNPKDNPEIFIVTGKRDKEGKKIGMFGETELHWHSNGTVHHLSEFKEILIALYCKDECVDTVFSLLNNRDAFLELPESEKDYWRSIEIQLNNFGHGIYGSEAEALDDPSLDNYKPVRHEGDERMSAVNTHPVGGQEFLYWQPPLIEKAWQDGKSTDVDIVREKYKKTLDRSIYQNHFVFKKGDFLIMDQLYTLHRRSPIVNKSRELWRVAFDYTEIVQKPRL